MRDYNSYDNKNNNAKSYSSNYNNYQDDFCNNNDRCNGIVIEVMILKIKK